MARLHVPVSAVYTVVHYTHKCFGVTRVQYQYQDTSVWSCTASPELVLLLQCMSFRPPLQNGGRSSLFSACTYICAQSLKLWTREWFTFALLVNVPSLFLHWVMDSFSNPRKARVKPLLPQSRSFVLFFHFLLIILLPLHNHNQQAGTIGYLYLVALHPNFYIVNMYKCIQYC